MIRVAEGDKIGLIYGPVFNGVDEKGDPKFKDLNGDGKIESAGLDRQVLGNGLPNMTVGLNNTFSTGNWSLNFFLRGAFGHSLVNQYRVFYEDYNAGSIKNYNRILTKLSDPKIKNAQYSSIHVEKADFLRLDNMQLGYNLPSTGPFSKVFVYLAGNNLFTITNYTGIDPEVRFFDDEDGVPNPLAPGIDRRTNYFTARSFSLGLNLGF
jgi:iron complex outermembrane receptor protein